MFKPVKAKTTKEYIKQLPKDRQEIIVFFDKLIRKTAPKLKPNFLHNMPGYGAFPYKNYNGEEIIWPTIAIASQKNHISIYVCSVKDGKYIAETHKTELGNVTVGKSCIRLKKIDNLNLQTLKKIIKLAEKNPGLTGIGGKQQ